MARWIDGVAQEELFTSVLVIGELVKGVGLLERKDRTQATTLERWLDQVRLAFAGRILEISEPVAELWGRLNVPTPRPVVDGLLGATARVHGLTIVTRNAADFSAMGVEVHNPFKR